MPFEPKPDYSPGLEGVIAGETAICWVDPNAGLLYRGYDIHELAARASFEEIVWLLLQGELPTAEELAGLTRQLAGERSLPSQVQTTLSLFPPGTHPMDMLRTGVSMLAAFDPELNDSSRQANLRKAMRLIAKVSTLITDGWRLAHAQAPVPPRPDLNHAANFLHGLTGEAPAAWKTQVLNAILVLTGLGTLKGPLHGGANEETMKMLRDIGSAEQAESWMRERLARKEKIMGFGHRVYKKGDSRVPIMREFARQLGQRFGQEQWVPVCERLEAVMEREKKLCANVDLYAAPVFFLLGLPPELNTPIFALSRVSGWCAHIIEQHDHNRLIRPRSLYTGPPQRPYPPGRNP